MKRIKKGDDVVVIAGKDLGRRGTVLSLVGDSRVLVEGLNVAKKHVKANPQAGQPGGIVDKEMPLHISNVMLFNPITKKGDRVGFKTLEDGTKVRVYRSNGEVVDV
ncbi:MAG: 50S ribosomal protein L24 [Gammaproteobacteria bacterium]|nr:50S ribosomal protein L24 [Gammaproteobacteria bacterium]NNF61730.1 50S ribosomal protein L24 [Gammaproteobacteria bacterium]NNM20828.1 50S ribosomal protein L24 [Gammaproteobacteria bacterium]